MFQHLLALGESVKYWNHPAYRLANRDLGGPPPGAVHFAGLDGLLHLVEYLEAWFPERV